MRIELTKSVDQRGLGRWAELSGDLNPLHIDPAYAAGTRYGGTIVHGHLTVAWLSECAVRLWGPDWLTRGQMTDLRFSQALRPAVEYRIVGEARPDGAAVDMAVLMSDGTPAVAAVTRLRTADR